jgi:DNA-binding winged helix-turn-helix (wHTH) protein/tetratricopeptide (TPR) repeat protein/TolB-like protein
VIYRFGSFTLDLNRGSLRGPGGEIKLRHQAFRLLVVLVEKAPNILSHDQLLDLVWGKEHLSASSLKQAISEVRHALGDDPSNPTFIETVHRRGYRFIAPIEVIDTSPSAPKGLTSPARPPLDPAPRSRAPFGIGLLVLIVTAGAVALWMQDHQARANPVRNSIAIMGFAVSPKDPALAWTSDYLGQTLANELLADATMRVIPNDRTAEAHRELLLEAEERYDPQVVEKIGRVLGADYIAGGSFRPGDDSKPARLDLTVANTLTGQTELTLHRMAPPGDFVTLTAGLGAELRDVLHPPIPSWGELPRSTPQPISLNPEVQELFTIGIKRLRLFDTLAAVDVLQRAVHLDPEAPLVRWKLAQALLTSGDQAGAAEAADGAKERANTLPREQQLAIEAFALEAGTRWDDATAKYTVLNEFIPDTVDYPLRKAMCLVKGGRAAEALPIFSALHRLPAEINADPRIALTEAKVLEPLGRLEDAETSASAAITQATNIGAAIVKASALRERAWVRMKLGRQDEAIEDLRSSRRLFKTFGHRSGEAGALSGLAAVNLEMGHGNVARNLYLEAETIFSEIGERSGEATVLFNLAIIRANSGDLEGSRQEFLKVLDLKREINDVPGQAHIFDALAQIDEALGDTEAARNWLTQAGDLARKTGDRLLEGRCIRTRADFNRKVGKTDEAGPDYKASLAIFTEIGNPLEEGRTLEAMAAMETEGGRIGNAVPLLESAVECYRAGSHLADMASALRSLAEAHTELGQINTARNNLKEAQKQARLLKNTKLVEAIEADLESLPTMDQKPDADN